MKQHMKQGWRLAIRHFYIVILLFLYQLLWGLFLYRFVDMTVLPLLRRFPLQHPSDSAVSLFFSEAQFQLTKTDLINPYLWLLGGLFAARMLLTPLFNAGLLYSLHHMGEIGETQFLQGIRKAWKPVTLLYWLRTLLIFAPGWFLLPRAFKLLMEGHSLGELLQGTLPGFGGWLLWSFLVHLLLLAMQFGAASGTGSLRWLGHALRNLFPYAGISLLMWLLAIAASLCVSGLSYAWAGMLALIMHQAYHLLRTLLKVWTLAAQYDCLQSKQS
ncbi:hypothetical protein BBD42_08005 [Paenibacillus sp. BIHB 4019]|uniref:Uncharacterized protein n=1 Tax=Paenibacillus sp. BIHB 4019 TaxID=1870819 RepID=A0A1B2DFB1_9BACL|nr:hypothetical protein [Paenibacillus sp. BIHB 4019]ANY66407.1 hypothetical protein BBD42_08005 [Paenibacillus sp. BIHB 4019]